MMMRKAESYEKVIEFVASHGFKGVSSKALAEHLGITTYTFYNDFLSLSELYDDCFDYVDYCFAEFLKELTPSDDESMHDYFDRVIASFYDFLVQKRSKTLYYDIYFTAMLSAKKKKHMPKSSDAARAQADVIHNRYGLTTKINPDVIWTFVFSTTMNLAMRTISGVFPDTEETRESIISLLNHGLVGSIEES